MKIEFTMFLGLLLVLAFSAPAAGRLTRPPDKYGMVIINNFSGPAGIAPVQFDHWLHRSRYTCRLCHIDVAFAMQGNATGINAEMNRSGYYCGACHNGVATYDNKPIFSSCSTDKAPPGEKRICARCHSVGNAGDRQYDYKRFAERYPRNPMDGLINWEEAELRNFLVDYLKGISVARKPLNPQENFFITSKSSWMPDIIFSHRKHAVWNGCEVCHPDIFPSSKRGTVKYTMFNISQGEYCGFCHGQVAFPINHCHRCHRGRIQQ